MENWIGSDSSPFVWAVLPLPSSSIEPDIDMIIESITMKVYVCNVGIQNQITNINSIHGTRMVGDCPSNVIVSRIYSLIFPEGPSEPLEEDVAFIISNGSTC